MKRWLALSIVVHAVVAGMLAASVTTKPAAVLAIAAPPAPVHTDDVIEVEFEATEPSLPHVAATGTSSGTRRAIALGSPGPAASEPTTTTTVAAAPTVEAVTPVERPAPHLFGMRQEDLAVTPASPSPGTVLPSQTFTMHVDPDGTAHLADRPNLQFAGAATAKVDSEVRRDEQWLDAHHEQSNAVEMKVKPVGATVATFDVTDAAMRHFGQDPYAYEKLKVLDATRDQRAEIGARHRQQQVVAVPALVRANLDEIAKLPADQRKASLAELWRDCDASAAGEVARATITSYVHEHDFSAAERAITE